MAAIDTIKNRLIDRIIATRNEKLLDAIDKLLSSTQKEENEIVKLTSEQIEMLMMGEEDIKNNDLISEDELDKMDKKWLK